MMFNLKNNLEFFILIIFLFICILSFSKDDGEDVVIAEQHFSIKCPITQQDDDLSG